MRYTEGCSLKCHLCPHRAYEKVTAGTYYFHLKGDIVMGVYPLLTDNTCRFAVLDFDNSDWERDGKAVIKTARKHGIPLVPEISPIRLRRAPVALPVRTHAGRSGQTGS